MCVDSLFIVFVEILNILNNEQFYLCLNLMIDFMSWSSISNWNILNRWNSLVYVIENLSYNFFLKVLHSNLTVNKQSVKLLSINFQFGTLGLISDHQLRIYQFSYTYYFIESIYEEFEMTVFFILDINRETLHCDVVIIFQGYYSMQWYCECDNFGILMAACSRRYFKSVLCIEMPKPCFLLGLVFYH